MKRSTRKAAIVKTVLEEVYGGGSLAYFDISRDRRVDACAEKILAGFEDAGQKWDAERVVVPFASADVSGFIVRGNNAIPRRFSTAECARAAEVLNQYEHARELLVQLFFPESRPPGGDVAQIQAELEKMFEIEEIP